jgi:hypothetical protein
VPAVSVKKKQGDDPDDGYQEKMEMERPMEGLKPMPLVDQHQRHENDG